MDLVTLILCRHGEGDHLVGRRFSQTDGPSLTPEGMGQAYRRIARQLTYMSRSPDIILSSPQLRAMQTTFHCRTNKQQLPNGKTLSQIPVKIMRNAFETTRSLVGQGNIIPPLDSSTKWTKQFNNDVPLLNEIENILRDDLQPSKDPRGSAVSRAHFILDELCKKYKGLTVLLICHDGIARSIEQVVRKKERIDDVYDLCECRVLQVPCKRNGFQQNGSRLISAKKRKDKSEKKPFAAYRTRRKRKCTKKTNTACKSNSIR